MAKKKPAPTVAVAPDFKTVVLAGAKGGQVSGSVNGKEFALPTGVEVGVSESQYYAVQAHIIKER